MGEDWDINEWMNGNIDLDSEFVLMDNRHGRLHWKGAIHLEKIQRDTDDNAMRFSGLSTKVIYLTVYVFEIEGVYSRTRKYLSHTIWMRRGQIGGGGGGGGGRRGMEFVITNIISSLNKPSIWPIGFVYWNRIDCYRFGFGKRQAR